MISLGVFGLLACYEVAYLDISVSMWVYIHSYAGWQCCCGFFNSHFFLLFLFFFFSVFIWLFWIARLLWGGMIGWISVCSIFLILCIHMIFPSCLLPSWGRLVHINSFIFPLYFGFLVLIVWKYCSQNLGSQWTSYWIWSPSDLTGMQRWSRWAARFWLSQWWKWSKVRFDSFFNLKIFLRLSKNLFFVSIFLNVKNWNHADISTLLLVT